METGLARLDRADQRRDCGERVAVGEVPVGVLERQADEVAQVREVLPGIGRYVDGPPCVMRSRAGTTPICPEGERFCGIPVWRNYRFEELEERRVV